MKERLLRFTLATAALLLLSLVLPTQTAAQNKANDENIKFIGDVIKCAPSQSKQRIENGTTYSMAWPTDSKLDVGTKTPTGSTFSGKTITIYELLFTVIPGTVDETAKTGEVMMGGQYYYSPASELPKLTGKNTYWYPKVLIESPRSSADNYTAYSNLTKLVVPSQITVANNEYGGKYKGYTFKVTALSDSLFYKFSLGNNLALSTLYLPETITKIGNYCFKDGATYLEEVKFYQVGTDGNPVWNGDELKCNDDCNKVAWIGEEAFYAKYNLKSLPLGSELAHVGNRAFWMSVHYPNKVITSIDLTKTKLTKLPDGLFGRMDALTSFSIPATVTEIGDIWSTTSTNAQVRNWNTPLTAITFAPRTDDSPKLKLDLKVFNLPHITEFTIPDFVTEIKAYSNGESDSRYVNNYLKKVTFSSADGAPTAIPEECFRRCVGLEEINWGKITTIGASAFRNTTGLTKLTIPAQITTIYGHAFEESGLKEVDLTATSFTEVPYHCFKSNANLKADGIKLPTTVTKLGEGCFAYCAIEKFSFLSSLTGLTTLGDECLIGNNITSLENMPSSVKTLGMKSLANNHITSLNHLPDGMETIGEQAFYNNDIAAFSMTTGMRTNLKEIGNYAFQKNKIPYTYWEPSYTALTTIGEGAFDNQRCEHTAEFSDDCTTVPAYIKGCPFQQHNFYYADDDTEKANPIPTCLRVIVPMSCINTYANHTESGMDMVGLENYRVKFKWGQFQDENTPKAVDYDKLYNITPQQRLIATAAWKNDILNFRPELMGNKRITQQETNLHAGKATGFDRSSTKGSKVRRKTRNDEITEFYANTVDIWNNTAHTAKPIIEDLGTFFDESVFAFNKDGFADKTDNTYATARSNPESYPQTLMPYTVHMFHANVGNPDEVEQISRRAVNDGIVPGGNGIIIDFPKPGYYLVPPAVSTDAPMRANYLLQDNAENPINNTSKQWTDISDKRFSYFGNPWIDLRNPELTPREPEQIIYLLPQSVMADMEAIYERYDEKYKENLKNEDDFDWDEANKYLQENITDEDRSAFLNALAQRVVYPNTEAGSNSRPTASPLMRKTKSQQKTMRPISMKTACYTPCATSTIIPKHLPSIACLWRWVSWRYSVNTP